MEEAMSWPGAAFDVFLVLVVLWLAVRSLSSDDMFKSVVLFIVFGFTTALSWMRLGAPDIALADAVIGAGITGALLLDAFSHFEKHKRPASSAKGGEDVNS